MKNILLIAVFIAGVFALPAQTEKGAFALGLHSFSPNGVGIAPVSSVGIGFGKLSSEVTGSGEQSETKYTTVGLNANAHYFLIDNLALGGQFNLLSQSTKEQDGDKDEATVTLFMAGPEMRYYIRATEKMKVWIRGYAGFGSLKTEYNGDSGDPVKLNQFGGGAGLAFFPASCFSIDLGAGYGLLTMKSTYDFFGDEIEEKDTYSGAMLDVGFTVFF